jgi:hypothetical protein
MLDKSTRRNAQRSGFMINQFRLQANSSPLQQILGQRIKELMVEEWLGVEGWSKNVGKREERGSFSIIILRA